MLDSAQGVARRRGAIEVGQLIDVSAEREHAFLDEAPEFSVVVLDALREPLESGVIALLTRIADDTSFCMGMNTVAEW